MFGVGDRVNVQHDKANSYPAFVRFIGKTEFDTGIWIGVEYKMPLGKHDGLVKVRHQRFVTCSSAIPSCFAGCTLLQGHARVLRFCPSSESVVQGVVCQRACGGVAQLVDAMLIWGEKACRP